MAYSVTPLSGINLNGTTPVTASYTAGTTAINIPAFGPVGTQVFANDGKRYVFGQAGVAIAASSATIVVNASTFQATLGAGSYFTATSMASGDYGWFSYTSV